MPAHIVRAILISVGVVAALGLAIYENPEVQAWLNEQRRKLAILLRNIGDELDPQSRREAEAFAFGAAPQARAPESATASGAETIPDTTIRRLPVQGTVSDAEREERQRLGEEYLARRNQQMIEMQERRRASRTTSFDSMVDEEGKLKSEEVKQEDVGQEIERCETPRPAVPPKIKLEEVDPMPVAETSEERVLAMPVAGTSEERILSMPGAMPSDELSYEDQLAIALMASKEPQPVDFDEQLRQAIRLSLEEAPVADVDMEDPDISVPPSEADTEDLYYATPNLTRATLAALDTQHPALVPETSGQRTPTEASSFAFETDTMSERSHTMSEAIEVTDAVSEASEDGIKTPDSWSEIGSHDADELHAV